MQPVVVIFVVIGVLMLLFVPRRWAPLPVIVGACYMGVDVPPEYGPARKATPVWRRLADVHKAERLIGFTAKVSLEEGLRQLVQWWSQETTTPITQAQGCSDSYVH